MSYRERRRRRIRRGRGWHCGGCGRKIYGLQLRSGLIRGQAPYRLRHDGCPRPADG